MRGTLDMQIQLFSDVVLSSVTQVAADTVTGFLAMIGHEYDGQLMVVGRAVNGWTDAVAPKDLQNDGRRREYAEHVYESVTGTECPMCWVTACWGAAKNKKYNTSRSAFWRVIRAVVSRFNVSDVNTYKWPSALIWSNLYKVSPAKGGNPSAELRRAQFDGCAQLFRWELQNYRPRRILFLTGRAWADPFLTQVWNDRVERDGFVELVGHAACDPLHAASCVVASHPRGKNETDWVNEVVAAFG